ncbi:MAG: insulinase family protein [Candidatus Omnitrophica bacterium]|nr:insulinase family protein [Candidatus Omnitrophota bacterium]
MRRARRRLRGLACGLAVACRMLLGMPDAHADTTRPRASVRQQLFDNGLQIVWEEDHRQPLVAIEARIKGGLRGEGRYVGTGITHFIEHMLFKGTTSRQPGTIEQEVRRYGGTINAFTGFDTTGVTLFVESGHLREALAMLADILQHAVFPPEEFDKERAVVISEIQLNLDDPDRRINQLFWSRHLLEHPYRHPIIGYQPLLERLTVDELTRFYAAQYQPQHVTIACAGDLDGEQFPALMQELFGGWPRGTGDVEQQLVPPEPPTATAKEASVELAVQTAHVILGFSSVRLSDPDLYALDVLANILGDGRSSRLYETVIRQRKLVHAINTWNYTPYDPGVFAVQFRTDPDKVAAATRAILEIVEEVKRRGVTDAELKKAKRSAAADYLFGLQTVDAKASDLASSLAATGDPLFSRQYVAGIEQVTREQVQAAAQRYLDTAKMTTAVVKPPSPSASSGGQPAKSSPLPITKTALDNGATTLIGVDRGLPIAAIVVAFHGGVRAETEDTQGLSNLVAQLLTKGTTRKNALEIAQQVESLGASVEPFSGRDGFGLVLQVLAQDIGEGLALVHELVTQSTFGEEQLETQRELIAKQLRAEEDEIFDVGSRLLRRTLFGSHPYRFHPLGNPETIGTLTRAQCLAFAKRWIVPSNAIIAVLGDIDEAGVRQQVRQTFGAMRGESPAWPARLAEPPLTDVRRVTQTMDKEQALILLGFLGTTQTASDRHALDVMTAILSGMAGRLFQSVREIHGLSYTLGAAHVPAWDPGYLLVYAATRPDEQEKVLELMDEQLQLAIDRGFTEEELDQARRYLIGMHRMDLQHLVGLAKRATLDELNGLGFDAWTSYEDQINAVTVPMVNEAAKRYVTMRQRTEVVISPNGHTTAN